MNTKQVLYDALKSQLDAKKAEGEKYDSEVYTPAINSLKSTVSEWLHQNIDVTANEIIFHGGSVEFIYGDGWGKKIELKAKTNWDNKTPHAELSWRSGEYSNSHIDYRNYLHDLSLLASSFDLLETKLFEWKGENTQIEKAATTFHNDYNTLKIALDKLAIEINTDVKQSMKLIGFEIKKFKQSTQLDWDYQNYEKEYKITKRDKGIELQYGRSHYDTTWVNGFKVLGKKGNKYKVEVFREGHATSQEYDVLEKKFDSFIDSVHYWENDQADYDAERIQRQYDERTKAKAA